MRQVPFSFLSFNRDTSDINASDGCNSQLRKTMKSGGISNGAPGPDVLQISLRRLQLFSNRLLVRPC